jgi:hypothetical protein
VQDDLFLSRGWTARADGIGSIHDSIVSRTAFIFAIHRKHRADAYYHAANVKYLAPHGIDETYN